MLLILLTVSAIMSTLPSTRDADPGVFVPTADFYNSLGANYESAFGHDEGLAKFLQKALTFFEPCSKVLDVGCGTGYPVASTIAQQGHHVAGIDIAPSMIELSRKAVPGGVFKVASMLDYIPKKRTDVVLSILSLFLLSREEMEVMSRKWAEWLKLGGILCIGAIAADSCDLTNAQYDEDGLCARQIAFRFMGQKVQMTLMTKEGWKALLERASFEILDMHEDLFQPPAEAESDNEMHLFIIARKK